MYFMLVVFFIHSVFIRLLPVYVCVSALWIRMCVVTVNSIHIDFKWETVRRLCDLAPRNLEQFDKQWAQLTDFLFHCTLYVIPFDSLLKKRPFWCSCWVIKLQAFCLLNHLSVHDSKDFKPRELSSSQASSSSNNSSIVDPFEHSMYIVCAVPCVYCTSVWESVRLSITSVRLSVSSVSVNAGARCVHVLRLLVC